MWFTTVFVRSLVCSSNQYTSFFTMQILPVSNVIFSSGQIKRQRTIIFGMRRWKNRWTNLSSSSFCGFAENCPIHIFARKKRSFSLLTVFWLLFWRWMKEIVKCQKLLWWERKISLGIQDDDDHFFMLYWNTFRMTKGHKLNLRNSWTNRQRNLLLCEKDEN